MGLFKSFFPGLAGNLDASLGDQYAPPLGAFWPLSDPEQVALDKALYDAGFKPRSASFDDQERTREYRALAPLKLYRDGPPLTTDGILHWERRRGP
jgi:hypothetical protein